MKETRRTLLKGIMGTALASGAVSGVHAAENNQDDESDQRPFQSLGLSSSIGVDDDYTFEGLSDELIVTAARDPTTPGQGQGPNRDQETGPGVIHITSIPGEEYQAAEDYEASTNDYGLSLVNLQQRELTISEIAEFNGDNPGLAYDWFATDDDVLEAGTDDERVGVGPGEVWLILQRPDGPDNSSLMANIPVILFKSKYVDMESDEWQTRVVSDELTDTQNSDWQRIQPMGDITSADEPISEEFDDYRLLAAGVGRGGLLRGPSIVDTFFTRFRVNGKQYPFPVTAAPSDIISPGRGRGN